MSPHWIKRVYKLFELNLIRIAGLLLICNFCFPLDRTLVSIDLQTCSHKHTVDGIAGVQQCITTKCTQIKMLTVHRFWFVFWKSYLRYFTRPIGGTSVKVTLIKISEHELVIPTTGIIVLVLNVECFFEFPLDYLLDLLQYQEHRLITHAYARTSTPEYRQINIFTRNSLINCHIKLRTYLSREIWAAAANARQPFWSNCRPNPPALWRTQPSAAPHIVCIGYVRTYARVCGCGRRSAVSRMSIASALYKCGLS